MIVKFNNVAEFLAELHLDREMIEDRILRLTFSWRDRHPFTAMSVLATAVVSGRLVFLERFCGDYMFSDGDDGEAVKKKAEGFAAEIRKAAGEMGLEIRSGVFQEA